MGKEKILIDDKDREILRQLQKNCKQPVRKIAKELGLRVTTTYDRIRRMEKLGIIEGYAAQIDPNKVGVPSSVYVLVRLAPSHATSQAIIAKAILNIKGISECHLITGDYDMIIKVVGEDIHQIGRVIVGELRKVDGVERTTTAAIIDSIKKYSEVPL